MKFDIKDVVRTYTTPPHTITYRHIPTGIIVEGKHIVGYKLFELDRKLMKELMDKVENYV